jgi:hypothetical protein
MYPEKHKVSFKFAGQFGRCFLGKLLFRLLEQSAVSEMKHEQGQSHISLPCNYVRFMHRLL